MSFELKSQVFSAGGSIPPKYSCDGEDISPPLKWENPPSGTESFALIIDDPDAPVGTWVHWVIFNLPTEVRQLEEGLAPQVERLDGLREGRNSWGNLGYGGPCPPHGTHRYYFRIYALDTNLALSPGATKEQLLEAMQGHILAQAELMGTYSR